ncbi:MAG: RIP metalloprotease RseP [Bacteroidaceae bacterium]|nr:RIP metalloprotease RseP [Bacteroidaceae bacterium]
MEIFFIRALQLIMALSLLVLIHEFGHFLFARIFKVRVEKFYLFFDWGISLLMIPSRNSNKNDKALIKLPATKGETEYGIGWIPLGGYCKISGMIDESMDTEQMSQPAKPYEFRSKPAWQRLLIMIGGVVFNFILALFIYSMVLFTWGESYHDMHKATYGMEYNQVAENLGFRDGDIMLKVDGQEVHRRNADLLRAIADGREVTVLRNGVETTIAIPEEFGLLDMGSDEPFVQFLIPAIIDSITTGGAAHMAGMEKGDRIVAIDNIEFASWQGMVNALNAVKESGKQTFPITVERDTILSLTANVDSTFVLGVMPRALDYPIETKTYGFIESFPAGAAYGWNVLKGYVSDFKYIFSKEGAKSVGMFGTIGSMFPPMWDWHQFWMMTAMLSLILAFMNILPIPALDGGHVLFLLAEVVTGRKPSDKFLERAQVIGMFLLLGLFILAFYNDLDRFIF